MSVPSLKAPATVSNTKTTRSKRESKSSPGASPVNQEKTIRPKTREHKSSSKLSPTKMANTMSSAKNAPKRTSRRPSRSRKRKYSKKKSVRPVSYLDPAIWGPAGWTFLHAITFEFPERPSYEQRLSMSMLMWSVAELLPCQQCCAEFTNVLEEYAICPDCPIIKGGRSVLAPWLVKVHNEVNERLDKPQVPYAKVQKLYYQEGDVDCDEYKN